MKGNILFIIILLTISSAAVANMCTPNMYDDIHLYQTDEKVDIQLTPEQVDSIHEDTKVDKWVKEINRPAIPISVMLVELVVISVFYATFYSFMVSHDYSNNCSCITALLCGIAMGLITAFICSFID